MPVTSFALLVLSGLVALIFAGWAFVNWGSLTFAAVVLVVIAIARWAAAPMPHHDDHSF
ncbi:hypothetical protein [Sagittula sp. SSi028]|uniref:hypothetical protein n=1 Tax=Sagittula sp. SSi028 TaxID=3400636 RepID=UPI003AF93A24